MSPYTPAARPLVRGLQGAARAPFSTAARLWQSTTADTSSSSPTSPPPAADSWELDPQRTTLPWAEKELMRRGTPPVGSRRRRAALQEATAAAAAAGGGPGPVPFELMPYQCFQAARQVLQADREDKLRQLAAETARARKLEALLAAAGDDAAVFTSRGGAAFVRKRLASLRAHIERLKILADINDPLVKRRFEDGLADMDKPIYRYLAEQRWRGRPLRLLQQRIDQFRLAPDLLPPAQLRPRADVALFFRSYQVPPGAVVDSLISEVCPRLRVQVFDRGPRLVSVAVVDPDVPDLAADAFARRCHFLAANIPLAPTDPSVPLARLDPAAQLVLPWLPAFAQKGSPPHHLAVFVLEQPRVEADADADAEGATAAAALPASRRLDTAALQAAFTDPATGAPRRDGFSLRRFVDQHRLTAVGCTLFRTQWDAGTAGADVELKPSRLPSLKPPRKARGWEAKHQGPKYRHLWKYTHRIATPRRKFVR